MEMVLIMLEGKMLDKGMEFLGSQMDISTPYNVRMEIPSQEYVRVN